MANLVTMTKSGNKKSEDRHLISVDRAEVVIKLFDTMNDAIDGQYALTKENKQFAGQYITILKAPVARHKSAVSDLGLTAYISITDAITALEEVSIDQNEVRKAMRSDYEASTSTLLAHTTPARKFQRRNDNKRHSDEVRREYKRKDGSVLVLTADIVKTGKKTLPATIIVVGETMIRESPMISTERNPSRIIFSEGFRHPSDLNPILDEASRTSTGSASAVLALCNVLQILFRAEAPRRNYNHGWGYDSLRSRHIVCT